MGCKYMFSCNYDKLAGHSAHVKIPQQNLTKLTIDNLVKLVLSSHHGNIATVEACKLLPTAPPTFQFAQTSSTLSSIITAVPPSTTGSSITNILVVAANLQASSLASLAPAKHSFKVTIVDDDENGDSIKHLTQNLHHHPERGRRRKDKKKSLQEWKYALFFCLM